MTENVLQKRATNALLRTRTYINTIDCMLWKPEVGAKTK